MGATGEIEGSQQAVNHYGAEKGEFLVTKDGEVLYAPGKGLPNSGSGSHPGERQRGQDSILIFP